MINVVKIANKPEWTVSLDKKVVGKITYQDLKFQYIPKGGTSLNGGEYFDSLSTCIESLQN